MTILIHTLSPLFFPLLDDRLPGPAIAVRLGWLQNAERISGVDRGGVLPRPEKIYRSTIPRVKKTNKQVMKENGTDILSVGNARHLPR